jgi:hypothetical protein
MLMCRAPSALALPLPLILVLASASGCSWFCGSIELTLLPPEPPPHWVRAFPELAFELRSPDSFGAPWVPPCGGEPGDLGHPGVLGELGDLGALGDLAALRLPKKGNWPVLAYPLARGTRLMPAGALYPQDLTSDGLGLQLSWEHGPAAEVLLALANEGFDVSRVNAERLIAEMTDRSNADPWSLDLAFLGQRLFTGEFRVTDIRLLPSRALTLEVPAGEWFLESPFQPARHVGPGEGFSLPAVTLGSHRLFPVDAAGGLDLFVTETEVHLLPFE